MRARKGHAAMAFGALACLAGCASILGIPSDTLRWCEQPEQAHHDFCEDFDHPNPYQAWPGKPDLAPDIASRSLAPGKSPPYALDTRVDPLSADASTFAGLETNFSKPLADLKVSLELDVLQANFTSDGTYSTGAGFLLVTVPGAGSGESSMCIALALLPASLGVEIAVVLIPNAPDCVTVVNYGPDGGLHEPALPVAADGGTPALPTPYPVDEIYLNTWTRLDLDIVREPDGSGSVTVNATPTTGGSQQSAPPIPPGSLGTGTPLQLGISTDIAGPSGAFEILFDDITVDLGNPSGG